MALTARSETLLARTFAVSGQGRDPETHDVLTRLSELMLSRGHIPCSDGAIPRLVFHPLDARRPRPFRRRAQATYVVGVARLDELPPDLLQEAYPLLIRALCNLLLVLVPGARGSRLFFVTLEQGAYELAGWTGAPEAMDRLYERLSPLANSHLVINNVFDPDLPEDLWEGDEQTRSLRWAGQRLDALDLLPAPFPIRELLPERDFRHVERLFGMGGLSYGNLSARKDERRFWMSASGVDKSDLRRVGEHVLLVTGYDAARNAMRLSVPPKLKPRRVSVDAIEHWMIYTMHPDVGAIVHVHAWMDGIPSTVVNYPCGTRELAQAVADLVARAPDPSRAVIGLKNHGLTITGRSLEDIFERIEGRIIPQVPMT